MVQFLLDEARRTRWIVAVARTDSGVAAALRRFGRQRRTNPRPQRCRCLSFCWRAAASLPSSAASLPTAMFGLSREFFTRVFDIVVGQPDLHFLVRPYSVVEDSRGRVIVTDPGAQGVHIFDPVQQKYKFIERKDKNKDAMLAPQCVAVDDKDNIYVTDSESGKIFVFNADGKYQHALGSLKGGEGFFKRPTGIAVDSAAAAHLRDRHAAQQDLRARHERRRDCKTIGQEWRKARRVQLSDRAASGRQGTCVVVDAMNFPRAGRSIAQGSSSVRHRQDRRWHGRDVSSQGHRHRFRRASVCRRGVARHGAGLQSRRPAALLLRAAGNGLRRLPPAHGSVHRSQRPRVRSRFLQPSRAGIPVSRLCIRPREACSEASSLGLAHRAPSAAWRGDRADQWRRDRHARPDSRQHLADSGPASGFLHLLPCSAFGQRKHGAAVEPDAVYFDLHHLHQHNLRQ